MLPILPDFGSGSDRHPNEDLDVVAPCRLIVYAMNTSHQEVIIQLVDEVLMGGDLDALERFYVPRMVSVAPRWIEPFRVSFPDVRMSVVQLISDGSSVAARFRCSGTHLGTWRGHAPTGRRFNNVDEVYFFTFEERLIVRAWGLEDSLTRFQQLGLNPWAA